MRFAALTRLWWGAQPGLCAGCLRVFYGCALPVSTVIGGFLLLCDSFYCESTDGLRLLLLGPKSFPVGLVVVRSRPFLHIQKVLWGFPGFLLVPVDVGIGKV